MCLQGGKEEGRDKAVLGGAGQSVMRCKAQQDARSGRRRSVDGTNTAHKTNTTDARTHTHAPSQPTLKPSQPATHPFPTCVAESTSLTSTLSTASPHSPSPTWHTPAAKG
jgi:hypothetical protein